MFQEYPKALYRLDEHEIVFDADEEKQLIDLGYTLTQGEPLKRKRKAKDDNSTANH
jgi:hypothetical protein